MHKTATIELRNDGWFVVVPNATTDKDTHAGPFTSIDAAWTWATNSLAPRF